MIPSSQYAHWYGLKIWKAIRENQLADQPLCEWCEKKGIVAAAVAVHHATPHKGDWEMFINGPFVSLCSPCHDGDARDIEQRGYKRTIDVNGYPIDPNHPSNRLN